MMAENDEFVPVDVREHRDRDNADEGNKYANQQQPGSNVQQANEPAPGPVKGPQVKEHLRLHHAYGGTYTDFDNESDLLDFVKDATTVKTRRNPDGSTENVFSPNAHLVHGAAHPDFANLRVEKVNEIVFPEDEGD